VPPTGDNDTSVTVWMVKALKAAERVGLAVDREAFTGALNWIDEVTDPRTARCGYDAIGSMSSRVEGRNDDYPAELGEAMTAAALYCRFALGQEPRGKPIMKRHAELILKSLPEWQPDRKANDMYYWYYGSLAMHRSGGDYEKVWKAALEAALLAGQNNDSGPDTGSWPRIGPWGWCGGRVYSTAIAVLSLTAGWQTR
jgi:hypothetical protein